MPAVPSAPFIGPAPSRLGAGTRSGFSALYSLSCFTRIRSAANVAVLQPALDHGGAAGLEQVARLAALVAHRHGGAVEREREGQDAAVA